MKLCYIKEDMKWRHLQIQLTQKEAESLLKKLVRHFKTHMFKIKWTKRSPGTGTAVYSRDMPGFTHTIILHKTPLMNVVTHEFAHLLANSKYDDNVHHSKKFMKILDKINRYVIKKKYFIDNPKPLDKFNQCFDIQHPLADGDSPKVLLSEERPNLANIGTGTSAVNSQEAAIR